MTNAEAREHLKDILADVPNDKCIDWIMALKQAIKALEQQPCKDWLSTFNTESATACYTAVQELKKRVDVCI